VTLLGTFREAEKVVEVRVLDREESAPRVVRLGRVASTGSFVLGILGAGKGTKSRAENGM